MVIDTSALTAILTLEDDGPAFERRVLESFPRRISAGNHLELSMVIAKSGDEGLARLDAFISAAGIEISPVTSADAFLAREAFLRYGKGRHPAKLNFGDCFAYALAKRMGEPLLFKGNDFALTDVLKA